MSNATIDRFAAPRVNIVEDTEAFTIEAEMPGVTRNDVDIEVNKNELTLVGRRNTNGNDGAVRIRERNQANYRRTFTLGNAIDTNNVEARMADGVLVVKLHKTAEVKPRKISIN